MKQNQAGFTLIELVMVIVILGVLAATALPKFVDLRTDASAAAVQGVAGAVSSASAINYSTCMARGTGAATCVRLNAANAGATLTATATGALAGGLPTGTTVTTDATCAAIAAGTAVTITLTGANSQTANATILCTG